MPTETLTQKQWATSEQIPPSSELETEEALRAEAIEQIHRERRFKLHAVVIAVVTPLVGLSWFLTEYYTAHSRHAWPNSFADAPAEPARSVEHMVLLLCWRHGPRPRYRRLPDVRGAMCESGPTKAEVDRALERRMSRN